MVHVRTSFVDPDEQSIQKQRANGKTGTDFELGLSEIYNRHNQRFQDQESFSKIYNVMGKRFTSYESKLTALKYLASALSQEANESAFAERAFIAEVTNLIESRVEKAKKSKRKRTIKNIDRAYEHIGNIRSTFDDFNFRRSKLEETARAYEDKPKPRADNSSARAHWELKYLEPARAMSRESTSPQGLLTKIAASGAILIAAAGMVFSNYSGKKATESNIGLPEINKLYNEYGLVSIKDEKNLTLPYDTPFFSMGNIDTSK